MTSPFTQKIRHSIAATLRPRARLMVSDHADRHRRLSGKSSSEKGVWRTARTPYLKAPMDDLSLASMVQRVVLMFPTQSGKTEVGFNWLAYIIDHAPAPTLAVVPTLELRKRWVRQRLDPMLTETPQLARIFDARKKRDGGNSEDLKDFPGGMLIIGGANSPASLSSMPIKYVVLDEVDRFPWEAGKEGDPVGLIDERQKTFPRRKTLLISTPTIKGESRIEAEFLASDQRHYHVPCPHCNEYQRLRWKQLRSSANGQMSYQCEHCEGHIYEHHKPAMLAAGDWVPEKPGRPIRGYTLNALYAPLGLGFTWLELWEKWLEAQNDSAKLKRFVNTALAEAWEEKGDQVEPSALLLRREEFGDADLRPLALTGGCDVQKNRLELSVAWWQAEEECWMNDHIIIPGDTLQQPVWDELGEVLDEITPDHVCIDSGYRPDKVKAFCKTRSYCTPTKGMAGSRPLVEDEVKRKQRYRRRIKRTSVPVEPIGVDAGKALLMSNLKLEKAGAGYIHFPIAPAFDDEYFAQLTAEKLVTRVRAGRKFTEWVLTRTRNETLDTWILCLVALRIGVNLKKKQEERSKKDAVVKQTVKPQQNSGAGFGRDGWGL